MQNVIVYKFFHQVIFHWLKIYFGNKLREIKVWNVIRYTGEYAFSLMQSIRCLKATIHLPHHCCQGWRAHGFLRDQSLEHSECYPPLPLFKVTAPTAFLQLPHTGLWLCRLNRKQCWSIMGTAVCPVQHTRTLPLGTVPYFPSRKLSSSWSIK